MSATDKQFRVIATGLRGGRANIAFDQALIEARREEKIPDTIRFLRFRPSALVGIHQYLSHELKLDYCKAHGIETVRRITGGGGLYFDEGQIGWELIFDRATLYDVLPDAAMVFLFATLIAVWGVVRLRPQFSR